MNDHPVNLKLRRAHKHIKARQYTQARQLLTGIDHPKAREWLARLDTIAPTPISAPSRNVQTSKKNNYLLIVLGLIILLIVSAVLLWQFFVTPAVTSTVDLIIVSLACGEWSGFDASIDCDTWAENTLATYHDVCTQYIDFDYPFLLMSCYEDSGVPLPR